MAKILTEKQNVALKFFLDHIFPCYCTQFEVEAACYAKAVDSDEAEDQVKVDIIIDVKYKDDDGHKWHDEWIITPKGTMAEHHELSIMIWDAKKKHCEGYHFVIELAEDYTLDSGLIIPMMTRSYVSGARIHGLHGLAQFRPFDFTQYYLLS